MKIKNTQLSDCRIVGNWEDEKGEMKNEKRRKGEKERSLVWEIGTEEAGNPKTQVEVFCLPMNTCSVQRVFYSFIGIIPYSILGREYMATIRPFNLIVIRIAVVLKALRIL